jgi:hypothetical protein
MAFHRLTTPSYFGGLPGGYGMINTGAALADAAKVGGPNAGTFFHAFGEDAISKNFNRPVKALSENTDYLDDLLHRDIVVMHRSPDVVAGGPTGSITLPVGTYLGGVGYTNTAESRARLFSVRDGNNRPILNEFFSETLITGIVMTGGDAIGGGFSANTVSLSLSPYIPTGVTYRVYYGVRKNLATFETDTIPSSRDFALIWGHTQTPLGAHPATAIAYASGPAWADGTTNPAATVEMQLDKIVADLSAATGAAKIGYAGGPAWLDAATNPAATVEEQFDKIITDLIDQGNPAGIGGSGGGAAKIGFNVQDDGGWLWDRATSEYRMTVASALQLIDKALRGIEQITALHVGGALTVDGGIAFGDIQLYRSGDLLRLSSDLTVDGALTVGAGFSGTGAGAWDGDWTFSGGTTYFASLGATSIQSVTALFLGAVTLYGSGHILCRPVIGINGDHVYGIADGDVVYVNIPLTAPTTYTVTSAGAGPGARQRYVKWPDGANDLTLIRDDLTQIAIISGPGTGSGKFRKFVELLFISGAWQVEGGQLIL